MCIFNMPLTYKYGSYRHVAVWIYQAWRIQFALGIPPHLLLDPWKENKYLQQEHSVALMSKTAAIFARKIDVYIIHQNFKPKAWFRANGQERAKVGKHVLHCWRHVDIMSTNFNMKIAMIMHHA